MTKSSIVFDDQDEAIALKGNWFTDTWSDESGNDQGGYSWSDGPKAHITFTFPRPAISFFYFGQPQCCEGYGIYQLCVDCDIDDVTADWISIDASDHDGGEYDPPVILYSQSFDTPGIHTVIIKNNGGFDSDITIDRIELQVQDPIPSPVLQPPSTATTTTTTITTTTVTQVSALSSSRTGSSSPQPNITSTGLISSQSSILTTTIASSSSLRSLPSSSHQRTPSTTSSATASVSVSAAADLQGTQKKLPTGAIAGIVIGTAVALTILAFCVLWNYYRRKKTHRITPFSYHSGNPQSDSVTGEGARALSNTARISSVFSAENMAPRVLEGRTSDMEKRNPDKYISSNDADRYSTTDSMNSGNFLDLGTNLLQGDETRSLLAIGKRFSKTRPLLPQHSPANRSGSSPSS